MTPISASDEVEALWLLTLQRAIGRASHDVKDALNGVSVNLEVIRSRSARPDALASAVAPFADAAGQQLERLTTLIEAVLALGRAQRMPADVGVTLRRVVAICGASASAADAAVRMVGGDLVGSAQSSVHGDVVRLALMAPLLDVVAGSGRTSRLSEVTCTLAGTEGMVEVMIATAGRRAAMPDRVADILRSVGVGCTEGEALSLAFPRA